MIRRAILALAGFSCACARVAPPASSPPTADAALAQMRDTYACGRAVQASAKIDHFGEGNRIRAQLLLIAARPDSIRMDVISPFGAALATLTSDGNHFALADLRTKRFLIGPASPCNIGRLTAMPIPGHVMVDLLRGEAPVLVHDTGAAQIAWSSRGYWTIDIQSTRSAVERIRLVPRPQDWGLPWERQRLRVLDVRVQQQDRLLYDAEMAEHAAAATAGPREDPDALEPAVPPSGPVCDAEIPRKIHVEVGYPDADVRLQYEQVTWNPPLPTGTFEQPVPAGAAVEPVTCGRESTEARPENR